MIWMWVAAGVAALYALGQQTSASSAPTSARTNPAGVTDRNPSTTTFAARGPRVDMITAAFLQYAARYPRTDELQYWQTTRADLPIGKLNAAIRAALVPGTPIAAPAVVPPPAVPVTPPQRTTAPPATPAAPTGRMKYDPRRDPPCYFDPNDSGPDQCRS